MRESRLAGALAMTLLNLVACDGGSSTADGGAGGGLRFNEVMPSNASVQADEFGEFDDWIELYNGSAKAVDLEGYYVSDDPADPYKKRLASGLRVEAGGVLLLWADRTASQGASHLPFKLNATGEGLLLTAPDTRQLDRFDYTGAVIDQSFARFPDGTGELILCGKASPGALNGATCQKPGGSDAAVANPTDAATALDSGTAG